MLARAPEQEAHDKVLDNNPDRVGICREMLVCEERGKSEYPEKNLVLVRTSMHKLHSSEHLTMISPAR